MSSQICGECQKSFDILDKEFNRQSKLGRTTFFCSRSCATKNRNLKFPQTTWRENFKKSPIKKGVRKGTFTYYLNKARNRKKFSGVATDIDEEYLQSIWTGTCAITGLPITLRNSGGRTLFTASLDRIDSAIGYIKGNVQFVSYGINLAKNDFANDNAVEFVRRIREGQN